MMAVPVESGMKLFRRRGTPTPLFQTSLNPGGGNREYDVTADGQRILIRTTRDQSAPVTVIQNWMTALKQ